MTKKDIILWQEKLSLKGILALLVFSVIIPLKYPNNDLKFLVNLSSNIGIALFTTLSASKYLQKEVKDLTGYHFFKWPIKSVLLLFPKMEALNF